MVEVHNAIGATRSRSSSYILATIPSAPSTAPVVVGSLTSSTQITVLLTALSGDTETGGTAIISYGLQMSSNSADEAVAFEDVAGVLTDSLALQHSIYGVQRGLSYAFRYRAKNLYGWSDEWSTVTYAIPADVPQAPPAPTFVEASDTSITIDLYLPLDYGGQSLTSMELWRDDGEQAENPTFVQVTTYDSVGFSLQHVMTDALESLVTGKIYAFKTRASNPKGTSDFSDQVQIAMASPPTSPAAPVADLEYSG